MKKDDFLNLLEIQVAYDKRKNVTPLSFSFSDRLLGTDNRVSYIFNTPEQLKVIIETSEFSENIQKLEITLQLNNDEIILNKSEQFTNEIFLFLDLDKDLDNSLNFIAAFITKILIPKFHMNGIFTSWK